MKLLTVEYSHLPLIEMLPLIKILSTDNYYLSLIKILTTNQIY